ncbi:MAG TPA: hypothetical protein VNK50_13030 [Calidithermus sp.]|nr:hypothetical protein [Calidithermus sp.]
MLITDSRESDKILSSDPRPVGCTDFGRPGSCSACQLAEAHVVRIGEDGRVRGRVATFYGARALRLAIEYAGQHAYDYAHGLGVEYEPSQWQQLDDDDE